MKRRKSLIKREFPFIIGFLLVFIIVFVFIGWQRSGLGFNLFKYVLLGIVLTIITYIGVKLREIILGNDPDLPFDLFKKSDEETILDSEPGWLLKDNKKDSKRKKKSKRNSLKKNQDNKERTKRKSK